jgi:riboflavin kinase/FMN adenylyltransferase
VKIYFDYKKIPLNGTVVTLGNFDGFHLGHQRILRETVAKSNLLGLTSLVMTFHPHPRRLFGADLPIITPLGQKLSLLKKAGASIALVQPFTKAFAATPPARFIEDILLAALNCRHVVVGYDYSFGRAGAGDISLIQQLTESRGIGCDIIPPVRYGEEIISSSAIRRYLAQGNVEMAAKYMGRPFAIKGRVASGAGRGKSLGFPTANLYPVSSAALPAFGVYLVNVCTGGCRYWGIANLGNHPTFPGGKISLEVFLFEFEGDLYGSMLAVSFIKLLRTERKFPDAASLRRQQQQDVKLAKTLLTKDIMLKLQRI